MPSITYSAIATIPSTGFGTLATSQTTGLCLGYVDNTVNRYNEVFVQLIFGSAAGTPSGDMQTHVWAYGANDTASFGRAGGTTSGNLGTLGSIAVPTVQSVFGGNAMLLLGSIHAASVVANASRTYTFAVSTAFNGIIPPYWGLVIQNHSGVGNATAAYAGTVQYVGVTYA